MEDTPLFGPFRDSAEMNVDELRTEVARWRNMASWIAPNVKYYLERVGMDVRLIRRDYRGYLGTLLGVKWELEELELGVQSREYDQGSGEYFEETKVVLVPGGAVMLTEFVVERELSAPEVPLGPLEIGIAPE